MVGGDLPRRSRNSHPRVPSCSTTRNGEPESVVTSNRVTLESSAANDPSGTCGSAPSTTRVSTEGHQGADRGPASVSAPWAPRARSSLSAESPFALVRTTTPRPASRSVRKNVEYPTMPPPWLSTSVPPHRFEVQAVSVAARGARLETRRDEHGLTSRCRAVVIRSRAASLTTRRPPTRPRPRSRTASLDRSAAVAPTLPSAVLCSNHRAGGSGPRVPKAHPIARAGGRWRSGRGRRRARRPGSHSSREARVPPRPTAGSPAARSAREGRGPEERSRGWSSGSAGLRGDVPPQDEACAGWSCTGSAPLGSPAVWVSSRSTVSDRRPRGRAGATSTSPMGGSSRSRPASTSWRTRDEVKALLIEPISNK